jgi:hypothetical protein
MPYRVNVYGSAYFYWNKINVIFPKTAFPNSKENATINGSCMVISERGIAINE